MRRLRFKPSLRDTMRANEKALDHMADMAGKPRGAIFADMPAIPPKQTRAKPGADGKPLERDVQSAVIEYLTYHRRVILLTRMNSGAARGENDSYITFHKIHKPRDVRKVDLEGLLVGGRMFAFECKRPGWKAPTDRRELEQANYLALVNSAGGLACFVTCLEDVIRVLGA